MARLHEYQNKQILAAHGVEIPRGEVAASPEEAREIAERLGGAVVVKAQIHSTSRAASGAIKFAGNADKAFEAAREIFERTSAEAVLVDEKLQIEREFYLGFIIDDRLKRPTLLFSEAGGSGIEERAATMKTLVCSVRREPDVEEIKEICGDERIAEILQKLYRAAKSCEARVAEINPLALVVPPSGGNFGDKKIPREDGTINRLVALDARISVDDYAVFRHEDLGVEIARELGHPPTTLERIAWEIERDDFRGTFYFVEILEDKEIRNPQSAIRIGFHGAGGGGSMASLDAAQRNGLQPACYVDTSGNPPASKVYRAAKIILSIPNIRGYFLSGSGVASQEQFGLARAVLKAFMEVRPNIPAVLRLGGNGEDVAKELVEKYAKFLPAPVESYQKQHSADFCAARLNELICNAETQKLKEADVSEAPESTGRASFGGFLYKIEKVKDEGQFYQFKTRTGKITFDHSVFAEKDATPIVEACPVKILKLDAQNLPVLAITREEAEAGKCVECLACEFASWEHQTGGVRIDLPIEGLKE